MAISASDLALRAQRRTRPKFAQPFGRHAFGRLASSLTRHRPALGYAPRSTPCHSPKGIFARPLRLFQQPVDRIAALFDKRQILVLLLLASTFGAARGESRLADARLQNPKRETIRLSQVRKDRNVTVLIFVASSCPTTHLYWERLKGTWYNFRDRGVSFVLVGGNSDDAIENFRHILDERNLEEMPIVWDDKHALAKQLGVEFTPEAVVLNRDWEVLYRGRIDDSWRDETRITRRYLNDAITRALEGHKSDDHIEEGFMGSRMR
jgi:peroxiredoxin